MPLLDILSGVGAFDLIERTSSTLRVQQVVQLSLAPAFLLAGIGAVMNVMTNRLIWVANKIERILNASEDGDVEQYQAAFKAHLKAQAPQAAGAQGKAMTAKGTPRGGPSGSGIDMVMESRPIDDGNGEQYQAAFKPYLKPN